MPASILIIGGGEIGTAIAIYLKNISLNIFIQELPQPTSLKRLKCFSQAIYSKTHQIDAYTAKHFQTLNQLTIEPITTIPIFTTAQPDLLKFMHYDLVINTSNTPFPTKKYTISTNCGRAGATVNALIQSSGRYAGTRQISQKMAEPELIGGYSFERVVGAVSAGVFVGKKGIGEIVEKLDAVGYLEVVEGEIWSGNDNCLNRNLGSSKQKVLRIDVLAPVSGMILGILQSGMQVKQEQPLLEIDPLCDNVYCYTLSQRARCVAGAVLCEVVSRLRELEGE